MYWACPDCSEDSDWAFDEATRCVLCNRTSAEVRGEWNDRVPPPVSVWLCVPCGGRRAQPEDEETRCFNCHRTFAEQVAARLMPRSGTMSDPVIECGGKRRTKRPKRTRTPD